MPTTVIHIKDAPLGWQNNPNYVYVGRANTKNGVNRSLFANRTYMVSEEDRDIACDSFEQDFRDECFTRRCHGDMLVEFVNHQ